MKIYAASRKDKDKIQRMIVDILKERKEIIFAYLHGSFVKDDFRDIDIAIYLNEGMDKKNILKYELFLERVLEEELSLPVDVRVLNNAPLSFRFKVIKGGELLFSRDEKLWCDFECLTFVKYHDFDFHRKTYRREALDIV